MPPPEAAARPLIGPNVNSFTVGSWCPTPDGTGKPEAVAVSIEIDMIDMNGNPNPVDIVLRIKSPMELDRFVQMLLRHKREVWPEAP
jgi:hypothetical protein